MAISLDMIARVQELRKDFGIVRGLVQEKRAELDVSLAPLLADLKVVQDELVAQEEALRRAILADYAATGDKQPAPGCGVRVNRVLSYSEERAFTWAKEHELALKLDKTAFEKIAKAQALDFVLYTEEPIATIAQDLDKALKE